MTTRSTMAVSTLCRDVLSGPRTLLATAYRGRDSLLLVDVGSRPALSLQTLRAVLLPRSLVVPALPQGSPQVSIGDGALWYDDLPVLVSRWFTPPCVVRGALRQQAASPEDTGLLVAGWRAHLGAGEGLTPYGDDVICGVMLGLLATDHEDADRLATEIRVTDLERRTTALSAALLRCACDGWCIPEVERVLRSVSTQSRVEEAVGALRSVGHSSGRGLLAGLASVLDPEHLSLAA